MLQCDVVSCAEFVSLLSKSEVFFIFHIFHILAPAVVSGTVSAPSVMYKRHCILNLSQRARASIGPDTLLDASKLLEPILHNMIALACNSLLATARVRIECSFSARSRPPAATQPDPALSLQLDQRPHGPPESSPALFARVIFQSRIRSLVSLLCIFDFVL